MDYVSKEPRFHGEATEKSHKNMSKIHGKDTNIEIVLRKALWHRGIRYRKNYKNLPGRPDIVFDKVSYCSFCDSEFFLMAKRFRKKKLKPRLEKGEEFKIIGLRKIGQRNMQRDEERKINELYYMGWTVIHFWGKIS